MMALKLNCQLCGKHREFNLTAVDDNGAAFEIPLCGNCIDSVNAIVRHRIDALENNVANLNEIIGVMATIMLADHTTDNDLANKLIELVGGE